MRIKKTIFSTAIFILFMSFLNPMMAQKAPASGKIMEAAYKQAKKEKKNVIVIFHASWCGWCKKMDTAMNDKICKSFFDDNYVTVHLTVDEKNKNLENPGADVFRKKYHGEEAGLPFWLIMDKEGTLLGDSFIRKEGQSLDTPGENIGCPAADNEVAAFCALLKKTSKITDDELLIIGERFKKNH